MKKYPITVEMTPEEIVELKNMELPGWFKLRFLNAILDLGLECAKEVAVHTKN